MTGPSLREQTSELGVAQASRQRGTSAYEPTTSICWSLFTGLSRSPACSCRHVSFLCFLIRGEGSSLDNCSLRTIRVTQARGIGDPLPLFYYHSSSLLSENSQSFWFSSSIPCSTRNRLSYAYDKYLSGIRSFKFNIQIQDPGQEPNRSLLPLRITYVRVQARPDLSFTESTFHNQQTDYHSFLLLFFEHSFDFLVLPMP